jgi:hypothetical protein
MPCSKRDRLETRNNSDTRQTAIIHTVHVAVMITLSRLMRGEGRNVEIVKSIATHVAALAAIGGAAAGLVSIAPNTNPPQLQLSAVGVPLPQDPVPAPAPDASLPTASQVSGLLSSLTDPSVSFVDKGNLVEGGIGGMQAHIADGELQKAAKNGDLPLTFNVSNIQPAAPGSATADVAFSGPKLPSPVTENVTFVNQGSWILSRHSAVQLVKLLRGANY